MEKIFTAKTVDEAKALAVSEIGLDESSICFEIIEQPKKGFFGGLKGEAKIKAIYDIPEQKTETASKNSESVDFDDLQPLAELPADFDPSTSIKVKSAIEYLTKVLNALGLENFQINTQKKDTNIVLDITGEKLGVVIGRRGETLDSLQYLAILASNKSDEQYCRIAVDCNGYREKRKETLEALAKRTAYKVLKQGRKIALEPMNPYERRIIHSKVAEIQGVSSHSTGTEPFRKVVIYADKPAFNNNRSTRSDGGKDGVNKDFRNNRDNRDNRNNRDNRDNKKPSDNKDSRENKRDNNAVQGTSYKQSSGFSTSFEREYKRRPFDTPAPASSEPEKEFSKETVDTEKNATLYGKIEF